MSDTKGLVIGTRTFSLHQDIKFSCTLRVGNFQRCVLPDRG
jgi:hypothetical protein